MMFNHIFWDFDGTLFDSYPHMSRAFMMMLKEKGFAEPQEDIDALMRRSWGHAWEHYVEKYGLADSDRIRHNEIRAVLENAQCAPYPEAEKLCRDIWKSGKRNYMYTHRGRSTAIYMNKYGLADIFTETVTATDEFARKPSAQGLLYVLDKHDIDPKEAIMIGDRNLDMIAAKDSGMSACLFDETGAVKASGEKGAADFVVTGFEELYGILGIRPERK